jgi:hypothetical protein
MPIASVILVKNFKKRNQKTTPNNDIKKRHQDLGLDKNFRVSLGMEGKSGNVKVDMKKRFVGLVVVPGRYISRIEVEE